MPDRQDPKQRLNPLGRPVEPITQEWIDGQKLQLVDLRKRLLAMISPDVAMSIPVSEVLKQLDQKLADYNALVYDRRVPEEVRIESLILRELLQFASFGLMSLLTSLSVETLRDIMQPEAIAGPARSPVAASNRPVPQDFNLKTNANGEQSATSPPADVDAVAKDGWPLDSRYESQ